MDVVDKMAAVVGVGPYAYRSVVDSSLAQGLLGGLYRMLYVVANAKAEKYVCNCLLFFV